MALLGGPSGCPTDSDTGYPPVVGGKNVVKYVCGLAYQYLSRINRICSQTAIAMGITASAPFSGVDDENLLTSHTYRCLFSSFWCVFYLRLSLSVELTPLRSRSSRSDTSFSFPNALRAQVLIQKNFENGCIFDGVDWLSREGHRFAWASLASLSTFRSSLRY